MNTPNCNVNCDHEHGVCDTGKVQFCRVCNQDSHNCLFCYRCAKDLPAYDYVQDDLNFDAAREGSSR